MPLLLRATAPSPSIDELAFAVTATSFSSSSSSSQRSVSCSTDTSQKLPCCPTHGRLSYRRRRSTAETESELMDEVCNHSQQLRGSQSSLRHSGMLAKLKEDSNPSLDSRDTQPDDDLPSSSDDASYASEAERVSSVLSCGCSCADANEFCITSSVVVIEDRQLAVVDKELRDFRKTFMRKIYTRLTKLPGPFGRKKSKTTW